MISKKNKDLFVFLSLNLALGLPAVVAQWCIKTSQRPLNPSPGPSPFGYVISLVLFWFPCVFFGAMLFWQPFSRQVFDPITLRSLYAPFRRKAFALTLVALCPLGVVLDIMFGSTFFKFPESSGVLKGFLLPAFFPNGSGPPEHSCPGHWHRYIPVEEMAFYFLGFLTILMVYIWSENVLFRDSKVEISQTAPKLFQGQKATALSLSAIGVLLSLVACCVRMKIKPEEGGSAWPGYFLFLLWAAVLPSMFLFHISFHFINWRALTVAWLFVLSISQFWEAFLGVPYQWWDYHHDQMMGFFIKPECELPIEAVLVWSLSSWTTIVVYERILAALNLKGGGPPDAGLQMLLGPPPGPPPSSVSTEIHIEQLKRIYQRQFQGGDRK